MTFKDYYLRVISNKQRYGLKYVPADGMIRSERKTINKFPRI